ncbi:hypothetical protein [Maribacter sp. 1_2014MBL_MicDiv]|uniref:hypothetical protein n=1 Tax=Maribacter sp. 1_2014MBL_MicDiv TaxID=1644130 RepID=UPI0008F4E14A|nr:hypothetical protein [Maribacter sp. 1_2014MBL_MicDiv]APA63562.1 hypothetical protein YQ22_04060 [Maribacter sp. 1_2014MBL_MicDiv]
MENIISISIFIHAFFGGVGLITGIASIVVKKGQKNHKLLGKWFSWSMIISSAISLVVARMPNHMNTFLFLIGIFTIYMVLAGNRALTFKSIKKTKANYTDKLVSGIMILSAMLMIAFGIIGLIKGYNQSILFLFFGCFGLFMPYGDFKLYSTTLENRKLWLINHLSRMLGALIASVTAFIVAGMHQDTLWAWITPSVLGTAYIIYWIKKTKGKKKLKSA